jgi:APA family basic amino acid/polyamine antiporter
VEPGSWLFALIPVMFTFAGWNAASYVAEEIKDPGRNAPKALAIGTIAVILIYLLVNLLYLFVIPVGELAQVKGSVLDVVADRCLARVPATSWRGLDHQLAREHQRDDVCRPRVYYAMARDRMFFRSAATVHPRFKTPVLAIVAQSVWSTLLVLSGSANALTTYTGFAVVLFSASLSPRFSCCGARADDRAPLQRLGYPLAPGIFAIASLLIVLNALWTDLGRPLLNGTAMGRPLRDCWSLPWACRCTSGSPRAR